MNPPSVFKLPGSGNGNSNGGTNANANGQALAQHEPASLPPDDRSDAAPVSAARSPAMHVVVPAARSPFVPVLLMALALVTWFGAQLWDGYQQRQQLPAAHGAQQQTVDNAGKLRQSLDALAADTQRMADGGNANAALLVTELRKRGITISVPGVGTTPTPPTTAKP